MDHVDSVLSSLDLFSDLAENLVRTPLPRFDRLQYLRYFAAQIAFTFVRSEVFDFTPGERG